MSSPYALSIYTEGVEEEEVQLPASSTRYFTADNPVDSLRTGSVPSAPAGHFAVKGGKLYIQVVPGTKRGFVRVNGRGVAGTGQIDYGDEIEIGDVKLLVVTANLPPLQLDSDAMGMVPPGLRAHESSVELQVINPALLEKAGTGERQTHAAPAPAPAPAPPPAADDSDAPDMFAEAEATPLDQIDPAPPSEPMGYVPEAVPIDSASRADLVTFTGDLPHAAGAEDAAELFMRFEAREAENEALSVVLAEMGFLTGQQSSAIREKLRDYFLEHLKMPADFGTLLVKNHILTPEQLDRALGRMRMRLTPDDGDELPEYVPEVDEAADASARGRYVALNTHFLDLARGRGDIDATAERDLRLGTEDGRVWLGQVAMDSGIITEPQLQELRIGQQVAAAQAAAQRVWQLISGTGVEADRMKEAVRDQVQRLRTGASADLFELLVERGLVSAGDVASLRARHAELPTNDLDLTISPNDIPAPERPPSRYRAGNALGREMLERGLITPVQYATLRRLQDGLRLSGHRRSIFDLVRARSMLAPEQVTELEAGYRSQVAQWEDEDLANTLVRLQVLPPTDRDELLELAASRRAAALQRRDQFALQVRLGLVMHDESRVPKGEAASRLLKAGVLADYMDSLGDDMRYPSDKATMEWAAQKFRISSRRQVELSCAHQEFCLMLAVPLITFLVDEGEVPPLDADGWSNGIWFRNLRTHEEKLFATAVASGLVEKSVAQKCLAEQAGVFQKQRRVTSAWLPWFRARTENPTRPVLPGGGNTTNPGGDAGNTRKRGETGRRTARPDATTAPAGMPTAADSQAVPAARAPSRVGTPRTPVPQTAPNAPAASAPVAPAPNIQLPEGIKAGRREVTGVYQRPAGETLNPLVSDQASRAKLDNPIRLTPDAQPVVPAPPALAPTPPTSKSVTPPPEPDTPRKELIEEWQALKVHLKQVSGEERERGRLREHDLRLMLENLTPSDSMALILIRQQQAQKLGQPHTSEWPIAEIERRFKDARREMDANWIALINGWMAAAFGEQTHILGDPIVYHHGPFDALVPGGNTITPVVSPPLLWLIPDDEASNFGSAPRIPLLGIDPRACRVDAPESAGAPHTLTISFQPEERGGGYLPRPRARLLEVVVANTADLPRPAQALGQFMARLLDARKRMIDTLYKQQARQQISDEAVHWTLNQLSRQRQAAPADRAAACKQLLQQLLKDVVFAIHPVEVRTGGLSEFLKISARASLVPDLAQQVVASSRMKPAEAATELDKAVRTVLAAVTRPQLHRSIFDPAARVPTVAQLPPTVPHTGMRDEPADPFVAALRYWRANPVPYKPRG